MLITLTPGGTGRREEIALHIQEVAPTDSRGGPHHVCGVALCSMWHFALRVDSGGSPIDSRGDPHRFKRWPPQIQEISYVKYSMASTGVRYHVSNIAW